MYLAELKECKLDFLEWTPDKGVKVSESSRQFAMEFIDFSANGDQSKCSEPNGAKKTFNNIASLLIQSKAGDDGTIPKAVIEQIAELSGTTDRRVYTVLEALEAEGWKPSTGYEGDN